ncbi:MAG: RHS repeat protein [Selenomonadaceae bacterium]|nr:RHS repeat protein [Selenomonadaceae bacterium]
MEPELNLPTLARHDYNIDYARGDFTLHIIDYAQLNILGSFTVERTYHSRTNSWQFNVADDIRELTLKTLNRIKFVRAGNHLIAVKDDIGRVTRYEYDGDHLTRVIYPDGTKINYEYDVYDQLSTCSMGGNLIFENEYDELGRLTKLIEVDGVRIFFYDDQNRRTVENGRAPIVYDWNRRKLIEKITYGDGSYDQFAFDSTDRLIFERYWDGSEHRYEYDGTRLMTDTFNGELVISYEYDAVGNLIKMSDSIGREEHYAYSSKNLLIAKRTRLNVKDWRREIFERDIAGRVLTHDINGRVTTYSYDEEAPVPSMMLSPCGYRFDYFYDGVYRLLTVRTEEGEFSFAYTPMNKLVADRKDIFDPIDRPEHDTQRIGLEIYDEGGRRVERREPVGDRFRLTRWKYDIDDNCIERRDWRDLQDETSATGRVSVIEYGYDAQNRLVRVSDGELVTRYRYDCLDRRVAQRFARLVK